MNNQREAEFQEEYYRLKQKVKELHETIAKYEAGTHEYALPCTPSLLKKAALRDGEVPLLSRGARARREGASIKPNI